MLLVSFSGCVPGYYRPGLDQVCTECQLGTFSDAPEASSCNACPKGTITSLTGQTSLDGCNGMLKINGCKIK